MFERIKEMLEAARQRLSQLAEDVQSLIRRLGSVDGALDTMEAKRRRIEEEPSTDPDTIQSFLEEVGEREAEVDELEQATEKLQGDAAELDASLSTIESTIASVQERLLSEVTTGPPQDQLEELAKLRRRHGRLVRDHTAKVARRLEKIEQRVAASRERVKDLLRAFDLPGQPSGEDEFVVRGTVRAEDGRPRPDTTVRAFDRDLRSEEPLGEDRTDRGGRYEITYSRQRFRRADKQTADLVVRALDANGQLLAESDTVFNAGADETVDLMFGDRTFRGLSEFERTLEAIAPVMVDENGEDVSPADLSDQELDFVVNETGVAANVLQALRAAFRMSPGNQISTPIFYGLVRQGLPDSLPELVQESPASMRRALETALEENLIPLALRDMLAQELKLLRELRVDQALETRPQGEGSSSLADILGTSPGLSDEKRRTVADLLVNASMSRETLSRTLQEDHGFTNAEAVEAVETLERAEITLGHAPLMTYVADTTLQDLSGDPATWRQAVDELGEQGVPPILQGQDEEDRKDRYARVVARAVERKFPTRVFSQRLAADPEFDLPQREQAATFLAREQDFDLAGVPMGQYLAENGPDLGDVDDVDSFVRTIEGVQRLHRLGAGFDMIKAFYAEGLTSALDLIQKSPSQLHTRFGDTIDPWEIDIVRDNATHKIGAAQAWLLDLNELTSGILPRVLDIADEVDDERLPAEIRTLFGSVDYCECKHCRSVLSPAAYLVDVLRFLKNRRETNGRTPLEVLSQRRPDLQRIELDCENTNTLVPYIDLVNEILEQEVLRREGLPTSDARQTTRATEKLRVYPEHLDPAAYQVLREVTSGSPPVYPWVLPFDLWAEETRAYLAHLDVDRGTLLKEFRRVNEPGSDSDYPDEIDVAAEQLGLTRTVWAVIAGNPGLNRTLIEDVNPEDFWNGDGPGDLEEPLSRFLDAARLDYSELLDLLDTEFVNPGPDSPVEVEGEGTCDTEEMRLRNLDADVLDRMHRFLRLQRHLGWPMEDLDEAIQLLGSGDLDTAFLRRLAALQQVSDELDQPHEELIGLWRAEIPRARREERLSAILDLELREFRTASALIGKDPLEDGRVEDLRAVARFAGLLRRADFSVAELDYLVNADPELGLEVEPPGALIAEVLEDLRQGLRKIHEETRMPEEPSADRLKQWLTALNWPESLAAEVASQLAASTLTPEMRASLERRLGAIAYETELDDLPPEIVFPEDLAVRMRYDARTRLRDDGATGVLRFAGPPNEDDRTQLLNLADGLSESTAAPYREAINRIFDAAEVPELRVIRWVDADDIATLLAETDPTERLRRALNPLSGRLREVRSEALVAQRLAEALGLEVDTTQRLLDTYARLDGSAMLDVFLPGVEAESLARTNPDVGIREGEDRFAEFFEAYRKLHRAALVISRFGLSVEDLEWLYDSAGPMELNVLPPSTEEDRIAAVDEWTRLAELMEASRRHLKDDDSLRNILSLSQATEDGFDAAEVHSAIGAGTGWNDDDISTLHESLALEARDYQNGQALVQLGRAFTRLARSALPEGPVEGVPEFDRPRLDRPVEKLNWFLGEIPDDPDLAQEFTRAVRKTLEKNHAPGKWPEIGQRLRDPLREKQALALSEYLLAQGRPADAPDTPDATWYAWNTTRDLHDYFLVDVEMTSCMMTSRIKLAHSSVQLFVQRCLMNLEPGVKAITDPSEAERPSDVDEGWLQWDWMKNYRVWEANRKIFLWPENWIEPELRDDKSPPYIEVENGLLQEDITEETAESAFVNYLQKLDTIARLEVCGMVNESGDRSGEETLHVIARTRATPRVYYYRRREKNKYGSHWTPWEKVDVDIEGDYLIPVIWHRRLYLFWPTFREKTEQLPIEMPAEGEQMAENPKYSEIRLAWSIYKGSTWSDKELSEVFSYAPPHRFTDFSFDVTIGYPGKLTLDVYGNIVLRSAEGTAWNPTLPLTMNGDTAVLSWRIEPQSPDVFGRPVLDTTWWKLKHSLSKVERPQWHGSFELSNPHTSVSVSQRLLGGWERVKVTYDELKIKGSKLESEKENNLNLPVPGSPSDELVLDFSDELAAEKFRVLLTKSFDILKYLRFFIDDDTRTFFAEPAISEETRAMIEELRETLLGEEFEEAGGGEKLLRLLLLALLGGGAARLDLGPRFHTHYHPYAQLLLRELSRFGVSGVLNRTIQTNPAGVEGTEPFDEEKFEAEYGPNYPDVVKKPYPSEKVDFSSEGAYSPYNWELFFHAPFLIADQLSQNQRFDEAQKWYHYIFDPTDTSDNPSPQRYWITKPFHERTREETVRQRIDEILRRLADGTEDPELANQVEQWREDPFNPHRIARLRPVAYQKAVVMNYLDNLVAWGDHLFRQDTIESINEATQIYMLAADILGPPPQEVKRADDHSARTFDELEAEGFGEFGNALVAAENYSPGTVEIVSARIRITSGSREGDSFNDPFGASSGPLIPEERPPRERPPSPRLRPFIPVLTIEQQLYFCIPVNKKLLGYWDTVADRLFKIRHCMNIEGVVRRLPLFEPPIEPGLLVRAKARGMDVRSALRDIGAALPHYRFRVMIRQAVDFCDHVRSFGGALQAAIEKRDAEELSQLRATHEVQLQEQIEEVRKRQIKVAEEELDALRESRRAAQERRDFYAGRQLMNPGEARSLNLQKASRVMQGIAASLSQTASVLHGIPDTKSGSPTTVGITIGGSNVGSALQAASGGMSTQGSILGSRASSAATLASYQRRAQNWDLQKRQAERDIERIDNQIEAAQLRLEIARHQLDVHNTQIENAKEVSDLMTDKFTDRELYRWMVGQISSVYFQAYELALEVAGGAQRAFQHELAVDDTFIRAAYWDNLQKGLLAGDKLRHDLKRMEAAYFQGNRREYEITKHISLRLLDPVALLNLRSNGDCSFELPEWLFELDFPGHYMRRLKAAAVTIPSVTGPYTSVNCRLTLESSEIRRSPDLDEVPEQNFGTVQSIVTSSGQNDSGLFQTSLQDERYLPFEGAGVINSRWRLEFTEALPQIDYNTISDVVLQIRYTAREGGDRFGINVKDRLLGTLSGTTGEENLLHMFSARHDLSNEWHAFLQPRGDDPHLLSLPLGRERFPYIYRTGNIEIFKMHLFLQPSGSAEERLPFKLITPSGTEIPEGEGDEKPAFTSTGSKVEGLLYSQPLAESDTESPRTWMLEVAAEDIPENWRDTESGRLKSSVIKDIVIVFEFSVSVG